MGLHTSYRLICDNCKFWTIQIDNRDMLIAAARETGWLVSSEACLCPYDVNRMTLEQKEIKLSPGLEWLRDMVCECHCCQPGMWHDQGCPMRRGNSVILGKDKIET